MLTFNNNKMFVNRLLVFVLLLIIVEINASPLDDYVHYDDHYFHWKLIETYHQPDYDLYILNLTSQKWLDG